MIIRFILVGIEGPVNLGMIARTCKNFRIDELFIVKPKASIDEALRYSAKAKDYLLRSRVVNDLDEALKEADLVIATTAKGYSVGDVLRQAIDINAFTDLLKNTSGRVAIMFGRESTGLTREELDKADFLVTIPANPEYPVLNISQAVAIFAWEIWKIRGLSAKNVPPRADKEELDHLLSVICEISSKVLSTSDKVERLSRVWRNIIYKSYPSKYEAKLLTYWAKRVLNKLERISGDK